MNNKMNNFRNISISVRCNQEEKTIIDRNAEEAGMTVSKYMVKSAVMGSEGLKKEVSKKRRCAKFCKIRTLLNELPRSPQVEELQKEVDGLWEL